ncbi:MAG TPA: response regulator [Verrucomicrobiota bacterium]|nr:response regulator [Verrucomicrobiota bacterium]
MAMALPTSTLRLRILVLEDEDPVRDILTRVLKAQGHSVEASNRGADALAIFHRDKFDLVITDLVMPEMRGDVFAAIIKATIPAPPVIMFTANAVRPLRQPQPNIDYLLPKPASVEDLLEAIALVTSNATFSGESGDAPR